MSVLTPFLDAGLIRPLDYEVALRLGELGGETNPFVLLAAALASHAPSRGDTCLSLPHLQPTLHRELPDDDALLDTLPSLPETEEWRALLEKSPLVGNAPETTPLVLTGSNLYLRRYFTCQARLADHLLSRARAEVPFDSDTLTASLSRVFPPSPDDEFDYQRLAAVTAVLRNLTVIAGGPGTGKTFTVRRILALLVDQFHCPALKLPPPRIALLAPTGKAATRMADALSENPTASDGPLLDALPSEARTIHQALGYNPSRPNAPRFHRENPLPVDVVVVDEASMVDVSLMTRLLDAVPQTARLILLGDPDQLASVEAGAVLADLCRLPDATHPLSADYRAELAPFVPELPPEFAISPTPGMGNCLARLRVPKRFDRRSGIFACATAVNQQQAVLASDLLRGDTHRDIRATHRSPSGALPRATADALLEGFAPGVKAARESTPEAALEQLGAFRVLCAHRQGSFGVAALNEEIESLLSRRLPGLDTRNPWYPGRPVLITRNDPPTGLANGDMGVVVPVPGTPGAVQVAFPPRRPQGPLRLLAPAHLPSHETVYAMTIHKSQGSQFEHVLLALPAGESPILTKELLYTAITRAKTELTVLYPHQAPGDIDPFQSGVNKAIERRSGLRDLLWGPPPPEIVGGVG